MLLISRCGVLSFLVCYALAVSAQGAAVLESIRTGIVDGETRIVFDLSEPARYQILPHADARELVIEFPLTELQQDLSVLDWHGTPVTGISRLPEKNEGLRLLLQLREPVTTRVSELPADAGRQHRVIVDLRKRTDSYGDSPKVLGLRIGQHEGFFRVVFDLTRMPLYKLKSFADEKKVVLPLGDTVLDPSIFDISLVGTPIESLRLSEANEIVFTLKDVKESVVFTQPPYISKGHRLVIDFFDTRQLEREEPVVESVAAGLVGSGDNWEEKPAGYSAAHKTETAAYSAGYSVDFSATWEQECFGDNLRLTAIAQIRVDLASDLGPLSSRPFNYSSINGPWYNSEYASLDLREFYLDTKMGSSYLRLGKQQVVWGQADGIKILDIVNPQSYREFILDDFDDSRIPLWMVNWEIPVGDDGELQVLWIPDKSYHGLAEQGTPYALSSPLLVPRAPPGVDAEILEPDRPDDFLSDADYGLRYRSIFGGWDVTLNYLYSYGDFPVLFQGLILDSGSVMGVVDPRYERNHLVGGTLGTAMGDFSLRAEFAWNSDAWYLSSDIAQGGVENSEEFSSVVGLDWQRTSSSLLSAQWFRSYALDYRSTIIRDRSENMASLLLSQTFENDSWEFRALALHSLNYHDSMYQLKLKYWLYSNFELWIGADLFEGDDFGILGQFSEVDRLLFGFQYGF
jgi:hypothetical protein